MPLVNGIVLAKAAITNPIRGILKPPMTLAMQKVIGTPITRKGIVL
jgi:hypothetical protein